MLKSISSIIFVLWGFQIYSQSDSLNCLLKTDSLTLQQYYEGADKMPEVSGGQDLLFKQLQKLRIPYDDCPGGKIIVSFIIESNGDLTNKKIIKDPCGGKLGEQVFSLIGDIRWTPGQCKGVNVPVKIHLPVMIDPGK